MANNFSRYNTEQRKCASERERERWDFHLWWIDRTDLTKQTTIEELGAEEKKIRCCPYGWLVASIFCLFRSPLVLGKLLQEGFLPPLRHHKVSSWCVDRRVEEMRPNEEMIVGMLAAMCWCCWPTHTTNREHMKKSKSMLLMQLFQWSHTHYHSSPFSFRGLFVYLSVGAPSKSKVHRHSVREGESNKSADTTIGCWDIRCDESNRWWDTKINQLIGDVVVWWWLKAMNNLGLEE